MYIPVFRQIHGSLSRAENGELYIEYVLFEQCVMVSISEINLDFSNQTHDGDLFKLIIIINNFIIIFKYENFWTTSFYFVWISE